MAESQASSQLADRVSCAVCMETFDNQSHVPKLLPCQHTFCQSCIAQATNQNRFTQTLKCPTCRSSHTVPRNGFTTNRVVLDIVDELLKDKTRETERQTTKGLKCESHANKEAVLVCIQCLHGLCLTCVKTSSRSHKDHDLQELDEAVPLLHDTLRKKLAARKTVVDKNISLLESSPRSYVELTKAEEDIQSIRDKISAEVDAWADNQILTIQQLKEKNLNREQEFSDLDSFKENDNDLTSLLINVRKLESHDNPFGNSILTLVMSAYEQSKYSERTRGLLESIQSTLTSKDELQSKFLSGQVEADKVDVTTGEYRAADSNRQPDSNIDSTLDRHISNYNDTWNLICANLILGLLNLVFTACCTAADLHVKYPTYRNISQTEVQVFQNYMVKIMFSFQFVSTVLQMLSRKIVTLQVMDTDDSTVSAKNNTCKFFFVMLGLASCPLWCYTFLVHPELWPEFRCGIFVLIGSCALQFLRFVNDTTGSVDILLS